MAFVVSLRAHGNRWHHLLAGCLFAYAIIVKFSMILMELGFVAILFQQKISWAKLIIDLACYTLLPLITLSLYFYWIYDSY